MSFCVKCGSEYDAKLGNNFCAHCGFDFRKNTPQSQGVLENPAMVNPQPVSQPVKKPVVGIVVALVLGIVGLLWTCAVLFHTLYGTPSSTQLAFQQSFPSLAIKTYIGLSFALIGNVVLIIGAFMAHLNHPSGAKVVRITSYSMIGLTFVLVVITYFTVTGAEAWPTLNAPTKGALIGGLVGGTIGALLQWGFLLFLFRNYVKEKTNSSIISNRPPTPVSIILCQKCGNKNNVSLGQTACFRCGAELPEQFITYVVHLMETDVTKAVSAVRPKDAAAAFGRMVALPQSGFIAVDGSDGTTNQYSIINSAIC